MTSLKNIWLYLLSGYIRPLNTPLGFLLGRVVYATVVLSVLIVMIMLVRKNLKPAVRSWLWALCIPALFIPFEHGIVAVVRSFYTPPDFIPADFSHVAWELINAVPPYIWLAGVIFFAIKTRNNRNNTMRLLQSKRFSECAAYFYKGRSHVYLPPDFETAYTSAEREMLLAHENQHITQHDPLLYRFLQTIQCVFWFNPLVHMAARCIRQDRELLCDERAVYNRSKREYGMLLLREAQKNPIGHLLPGIVAETGGVYERITACVKPFSEKRKSALVVAGIAAAIFVVGLMGFAKPIVSNPMETWIFVEQDGNFSRLESAEKFAILESDGVTLDQQGLFEHAMSIGLEPYQKMDVCVIAAKRMSLIGEHTSSIGSTFMISQLKTEDIFIPYYGSDFSLVRILFKLL